MEQVVLAVFRAYQRFISPMKPPSCRFHPTCSSYGLQAVMRYGWKRGLWLTTLRLLRCHPLHPGGDDPLS